MLIVIVKKNIEEKKKFEGQTFYFRDMTKVKLSWIYILELNFPLNIVYEHLLLSSFNAAISGL